MYLNLKASGPSHSKNIEYLKKHEKGLGSPVGLAVKESSCLLKLFGHVVGLLSISKG